MIRIREVEPDDDGGGVDALTPPVAVLAVLANVALVYYLFTVSRRGYGEAVPVVAG